MAIIKVGAATFRLWAVACLLALHELDGQPCQPPTSKPSGYNGPERRRTARVPYQTPVFTPVFRLGGDVHVSHHKGDDGEIWN